MRSVFSGWGSRWRQWWRMRPPDEHAARGDDHRRALHLVERLRLRARAVEVDPLAVEEAPAADVVEARPGGVGVRRVDPGGVDRHRAVDVDGERPQPALGHQLVHQVDHLLGPAHREGGDHQDAAPRERLLEDALQLVEDRQCRVRPVPVGALHHQVVGLGRGLGVLRQDGVEASHVAAEEDARLPAVLPDRDVRGSGAEEVPGVAVGERERVVHLLRPAQGQGQEEPHRRLNVRLVEERQRGLVLGEPLAVQVLGVFLLQVGGVEEEDLGQVLRGRRAVDGTAEALLDQAGHAADVVEVGVGEHDRIHLRRVELRVRPVPEPQGLLALEHPGVHEEAPSSRLQQVLGSGHRLRRAEEGQSGHGYSIFRSTVWRMPPFL